MSPSFAQPRDRGGRSRLDRVGDHEHAAGVAVPADGDRGAALRLGLVQRVPAAVGQVVGTIRRAVGGARRAPRARRRRPRRRDPRRLVNAFDCRETAGRSGQRRRSRLAIGCSDATSSGARESEYLVCVLAVGDARRRQGHHAGCDRAGLVEHDGVDPAGGLQHLGALDQDAQLCAAAGADHQRGRRGQPERARAGDDQHRDRGGEGGRGRRRAGEQPDRQRGRATGRSRRARTLPRSGRPAAAPAPCRSGLPRPAAPSARAGCRTRLGWRGRPSRPPVFTVAPTTSIAGLAPRPAPIRRSAWTRRPRSGPRRRRRRSAIFSPGRTTNRQPTGSCSIGIALLGRPRSTATSLRTQVEQRAQRRAGAAAWRAPRSSGRRG